MGLDILLILIVAGLITQAIHEGKRTMRERWAGTGSRWADAIAPGNQTTGWGRRGARLARGAIKLARGGYRVGRSAGTILAATLVGAARGVRQGVAAWKAWRDSGASRADAIRDAFRRPPADGTADGGDGTPAPDAPPPPSGGRCKCPGGHHDDEDDDPHGDGPSPDPDTPRRGCASCQQDLLPTGDGGWKHRGGTCPSTPALTSGPADTTKGESMSENVPTGDAMTHEQARATVVTALDITRRLSGGLDAMDSALAQREAPPAVRAKVAAAMEATDNAAAQIQSILDEFAAGGHDDAAASMAGLELAGQTGYYTGVN